MTELSIGTIEMPAAVLGPESPLPPLNSHVNASSSATHFHDSIPQADRKFFGYSGAKSSLPYLLQSNYDRRRIPQSFKTAILENEILKAVFLLEWGGRLWSLYHKPSGRELLHVTPEFQLAHLAIRNAWFCGGVEWNACIIGHSPLTCSPVFAAQLKDENGTPVLRLYEWDRVACIPIQIDFFLPSQSPFLFSRVRLINPHACEIPMYWWSNIAVPEQPGTRVLAPANTALRHTYQGEWRLTNVPMDGNTDITRPVSFKNAADAYFRIPDDHRPWIAALDGNGVGLCHASTCRLKGRKLFVWGMNKGGRHWQEFLSGPGLAYIEIQAGLARTQFEYLPMPAGGQWSWLEAYGYMEADPHLVHGSDWQVARNDVEQRLDRVLPQGRLEAELVRTEWMSVQRPGTILHRGSGWGALERRRREVSGEPPFCDAALVFDDASLASPQAPWLDLLKEGTLPCKAPEEQPLSWMVQPEWRRLLEKSLRRKDGAHWAAHLYRGLMQYDAGEFDAARRSWKRSLKLTPNAWALRDLAILAHQRKHYSEAADLWQAALKLHPALPDLACETIMALFDAKRGGTADALISGLPASVRKHGRIRLLGVRAAMAVNDLERADMILRNLEVHDLHEGEISLSEIWYDLQARRAAQRDHVPIDEALRARIRAECPVPCQLDFSVN